MKTKQEQIEEIVKILLDASKKCLDADCDCCDKQYEKDCAQYRKAVALVQAGYGDVSEYKAEIERLRTTLGQCNTELNSALESLKSQCREIGALKAGTKQAKIDVLNELKDKMFEREYMGVKYKERIFYESEIDDMIAEMQNGEDKG